MDGWDDEWIDLFFIVRPTPANQPTTSRVEGWRTKNLKIFKFQKKKKKRRRRKKKGGDRLCKGREGGRKGMPSRRRAGTGGNGRGSKGGRYRGRAGNAAHGGRSAGGGQGQGGQGGGDHGILLSWVPEKVGQRVAGSADLCIILRCGMLAQFCVPLGIFLAAAYSALSRRESSSISGESVDLWQVGA